MKNILMALLFLGASSISISAHAGNGGIGSADEPTDASLICSPSAMAERTKEFYDRLEKLMSQQIQAKEDLNRFRTDSIKVADAAAKYLSLSDEIEVSRVNYMNNKSLCGNQAPFFQVDFRDNSK